MTTNETEKSHINIKTDIIMFILFGSSLETENTTRPALMSPLTSSVNNIDYFVTAPLAKAVKYSK